MGTRCGDIDPAIVFYLMERGHSPKELYRMLNNESGLLGLSGISNDLRDLEAAATEGDQRAIDALEVYAYRIRKYIGAYAANLVKVGHPQAALRGHHPPVRGLVHEVVSLEGDHPRGVEQQCGVIPRNERSARDHLVAALREVLDVPPPDLARRHLLTVLPLRVLQDRFCQPGR